jgi:hypothetical protein
VKRRMSLVDFYHGSGNQLFFSQQRSNQKTNSILENHIFHRDRATTPDSHVPPSSPPAQSPHSIHHNPDFRSVCRNGCSLTLTICAALTSKRKKQPPGDCSVLFLTAHNRSGCGAHFRRSPCSLPSISLSTSRLFYFARSSSTASTPDS